LAVFCHRVEEFCLRLGRSGAGGRAVQRPHPLGKLQQPQRHPPALAPDPPAAGLIDYVVAHEVAHLVEMNHSPRFWSVVASLYPDHVAARQALRQAAAALPAL
jgi:hypothetical protein